MSIVYIRIHCVVCSMDVDKYMTCVQLYVWNRFTALKIPCALPIHSSDPLETADPNLLTKNPRANKQLGQGCRIQD